MLGWGDGQAFMVTGFGAAGTVEGLAVEPVVEDGFDGALSLGADLQRAQARRLERRLAEHLGQVHDAHSGAEALFVMGPMFEGYHPEYCHRGAQALRLAQKLVDGLGVEAIKAARPQPNKVVFSGGVLPVPPQTTEPPSCPSGSTAATGFAQTEGIAFQAPVSRDQDNQLMVYTYPDRRSCLPQPLMRGGCPRYRRIRAHGGVEYATMATDRRQPASSYLGRPQSFSIPAAFNAAISSATVASSSASSRPRSTRFEP